MSTAPSAIFRAKRSRISLKSANRAKMASTTSQRQVIWSSCRGGRTPCATLQSGMMRPHTSIMTTVFRNRQTFSRATFPDLRSGLGATSSRGPIKSIFARTHFRRRVPRRHRNESRNRIRAPPLLFLYSRLPPPIPLLPSPPGRGAGGERGRRVSSARGPTNGPVPFSSSRPDKRGRPTKWARQNGPVPFPSFPSFRNRIRAPPLLTPLAGAGGGHEICQARGTERAPHPCHSAS